MKIAILILVAALCAALCFLPFELPKKGYVKSQKPTTVAGVAMSLFEAIRASEPGKSAAAIAAAIALFAVWSPLIILLEARLLSPPLSDGGQSLFFAQGVLIALAGAASFLVLAMNSMNFGFGASKSTEFTPLFAVILVVEGASAVASIALGIWPAAVNWLHTALA